ncbi:hypothetical protein J7E96_35755 [Streptomyces sp. ISL-96]|uniref:hypothetical protein n=1 Tax=Streptomyces sp. ISL-96 TaxID=2819191 RepID=UPI001BE5B584|nr:hypothetical protein [Streptomyces sp. ISL-96]MBT2493760.1 hypothetical protein [Streptomyces sp. ISL-96]
MRASRACLVTAVAWAAVGLAAPIAAATNGPSNVNVNPFRVHQGGVLTVSASGCGHGGTVSSHVFQRTAHLPASDTTSYATAKIRHNATPGTYHLAVKCNDNPKIVTHQFRVVAGHGAHGGIGGSVGPSDTEMQVGAGLVSAAAVGGGLFIARRRRLNRAEF